MIQKCGATSTARFETELAKSCDIQRMLVVALSTGGVPANFIENPFLRMAFETLGYNLKGRHSFEECKQREAIQALNVLREQIRAEGFGTVAIDGRKMSEHRDKAHMLNFAWISKDRERFLRSEVMSHLRKDAAVYWEFMRSAWQSASDAETLGEPFEHTHLPPVLAKTLIAALSLDCPSVNMRVLKMVEEAMPRTAPVPCAFHSFDSIVEALMKGIEDGSICNCVVVCLRFMFLLSLHVFHFIVFCSHVFCKFVFLLC